MTTAERRDNLLSKLRKGLGDEEGDHGEAEELLVEYLISSGDTELAQAWKDAQRVQNWWYA